MKANAPKRKVFQDALDLLTEDPVEERAEPGAEDPIPDRYVSGHPVSGGNLL